MVVFPQHLQPITAEAVLAKFTSDFKFYMENRKAEEMRVEIRYEDGKYLMLTLPKFKAAWCE